MKTLTKTQAVPLPMANTERWQSQSPPATGGGAFAVVERSFSPPREKNSESHLDPPVTTASGDPSAQIYKITLANDGALLCEAVEFTHDRESNTLFFEVFQGRVYLPTEQEFDRLLEYVLQKNGDLYRRLA